MKKTIFCALLAIFSLSASPAFATKSSKNIMETSVTKNGKLTEEEINYYKERVEEIRNMDKTELTVSEKKELKNELKEIKEIMHRNGVYFYVGGSTLVIIILILLLV